MNNNSVLAPRQPNLREEIRLYLLRLANRNGGLRDLAGKADLSYNALWGQLNRGQGVLADVIPQVVQTTGDFGLLSLLAESCGFLVAPKPRFVRTRREIWEREKSLMIAVCQAFEAIKQAHTKGLIGSVERERIRAALSRVCANSLEIGETIEKGHFLRKRSR